MGRRRGGIPDRWQIYSPVGARIAGTSFIAFKVPLKEHLVSGLPVNERFTTQALMDSVPGIGLIVDLTNTDRYYNSEDFLRQGIRYEKIFCRGHEIPSQSVVDSFFSVVDAYLEYLKSCPDNHDEDKLIGVHCTHGLNRTGYLVCRYMIKRLGFSPEDAIAAFEKARGYPMEREEYVKHLYESENNSVAADIGVNFKSDSPPDNNRFNPISSSSRRVETGNPPGFRQNFWTDSGPSQLCDMRTCNFTDFSDNARTNSFEGFLAEGRDGSNRSLSQNSRANSHSWPPGNDRADSDGFPDSSRYSQTFRGHPYREEIGASFEPEEYVYRNSPSVSRRFYEQDYEADEVLRPQRYDYHARSTSLYSQRSRQTSPRRRYRSKD